MRAVLRGGGDPIPDDCCFLVFESPVCAFVSGAFLSSLLRRSVEKETAAPAQLTHNYYETEENAAAHTCTENIPSSEMQPQILVLKEGTETAQGKAQVVSNINACQAVVDAIRTTLGPRGMDKLIVDQKGAATISNDGATIMKLLDIVHPAAKTLVDIAKSQDAEVGDGTTSVVILAGEFLKQCKPFVEEGVHPRVIIK